MLDIKVLRDQPEMVKAALAKKGVEPQAVDALLTLDVTRREIQSELDAKRSEQKQIDFRSEAGLAQAKELKTLIDNLEAQLSEVTASYTNQMLLLPNLPDASAPVGEGESANRVIRTVGTPPPMADAEDHLALGEELDLLDIERGVKIAESRFAFLKNQAVLLEFALVRFALDVAQKHGFTPMVTPELVNEKTVTGTGYLPQGADEVYKTQDNLYLIGTSELALVAYHMDEILSESELPKRYVGFSSCFRREAGSYGKDTRGILRMHQFDKVELVSLVTPEKSNEELERILAIEEEIMQTLGLPYEVMEIGTGDLGVQATKKYDLNTWMPGQGKYRETHSCSNTTDFQSRRLNIRYKSESGENIFVHTLNGTAVAVGRMLIAIMENGQQPDGSIRIPEALVKYTGFEEIKK